MPNSESRKKSPYPRLGVGILVFRDQQFLLVKRGQEPRKGIWTLPGGMVELGETLQQAALRELEEECGIQAGISDYRDIFEFIQYEMDQVLYHYVIVDFVGTFISGTLSAQSDIVEAAWLGLEDLERLLTTDETRSFITKAIDFRAGSSQRAS